MKNTTHINGAIETIKRFLKNVYIKLGLHDKQQAYNEFLKRSVMKYRKQAEISATH